MAKMPPRTDWDRVQRLFGEMAFNHLRTATVGILGCGSGGSKVALELACSGVGRFVLVDPEDLDETNVVRHAADDRYIGMAKTDAVADLIRHRPVVRNRIRRVII